MWGAREGNRIPLTLGLLRNAPKDLRGYRAYKTDRAIGEIRFNTAGF